MLRWLSKSRNHNDGKFGRTAVIVDQMSSAALRARRLAAGAPELCVACSQGHLEVAQRLHSAGAPLNATCDIGGHIGVTPLLLACSNGHLHIAQWLHSVGASLIVTNNMRQAPLHLACLKGHLETAQWLHSMGASLNATDPDGSAPLHHACMRGHLDVAQWLHDVGASLNATDNRGNTPLHHTCTRSDLDVAQWLHGAGASLNATNNRGYTPLHKACDMIHLDMIHWLCSVGVDATIRAHRDTPAKMLRRRCAHNRHWPSDTMTTMETLLAAERRVVELRARAAGAALLAEKAEAALLAETLRTVFHGHQRQSARKLLKRWARRWVAKKQLKREVEAARVCEESAAEAVRLAAAEQAREVAALVAARAAQEAWVAAQVAAQEAVRAAARVAAASKAREEAPARHALQALQDASGHVALRAALFRAEALVEDFSELLFDAMVAANKRLQELERQLEEESRAEAKTRHIEEHALRFEVHPFDQQHLRAYWHVPIASRAPAPRLYRLSQSTKPSNRGRREIRCTTPIARRAVCVWMRPNRTSSSRAATSACAGRVASGLGRIRALCVALQ